MTEEQIKTKQLHLQQFVKTLLVVIVKKYTMSEATHTRRADTEAVGGMRLVVW